MKNKELILVCALRYALGRRSYIVGVVEESILAEWNDLTPTCRASLVVDITEYLMISSRSEDTLFHDSSWADSSWAELGKNLYEKLPDEDKMYVQSRLAHKPQPFPFIDLSSSDSTT